MRLLRPLLLVSCLLLAAAPALAYVAQSVTVDGINDFDSGNLVVDDRFDTQRFYCAPDSIYALDLGRAYLANDNNFLYIGYDWPHKWGCYDQNPKPNLGIAIDVNTVAGGTADPWGRRIGWSNLSNRPDFMIYDVPKNPQDSYHFQVMYKWTGTAWGDSTRLVNGTGSGPNALGMVDTSGFVELKLPLSALGVTTGSQISVEWWYTQDAGTKGPLDAVMSTNVQMSHAGNPGTTTWDTTAVVQMSAMAPYTILAFTDAVPPTVTQAVATGFTLLGNKQYALTTNKVDVTFSEPVELLSANTATNYVFSGPVTRTVLAASRDVSATNVVHLLLSGTVAANAAFNHITVSNVKDLASNTIVANGTTNVGSFFIQNLVFQVDPGVALCRGTATAADTFAVEGSLLPLTFDPTCDNAFMYDGDANLVWDITVPFAMPMSPVTGRAETDLEYKYSRLCGFEGYGNRTYHVTSDNGASVTLTDYWNRENPADFTAHAVDVIFQVNAASATPTPADTLFLKGSESPLSFDAVSSGPILMDDGVNPDGAPGDKIYTARVRFPKCSVKNVEWKVFYRGAFECTDQGNRTVWVNDAVFDTVGGALGPIVLPARGIERCTKSDKAITVVFHLNMGGATVVAGDTVAVVGSEPPLAWERPLDPLTFLQDDGASYDATAGDRYYAGAITFPENTNLTTYFKYWLNGNLECYGMGNRTFTLDDVSYSTTTPLVLPQHLWDYCSDEIAGVPAAPPVREDASASFAALMQSFPNPMTPRATIRFDLKRGGEVSLRVYDVAGRRVATLARGVMQAGPHDVRWDGRDDHGNLLQSGVYVYELAMGKERLSRRIAIMR